MSAGPTRANMNSSRQPTAAAPSRSTRRIRGRCASFAAHALHNVMEAIPNSSASLHHAPSWETGSTLSILDDADLRRQSDSRPNGEPFQIGALLRRGPHSLRSGCASAVPPTTEADEIVQRNGVSASDVENCDDFGHSVISALVNITRKAGDTAPSVSRRGAAGSHISLSSLARSVGPAC